MARNDTFYQDLKEAYAVNHALMEKALLGIPAAFLVFVGTIFAFKKDLTIESQKFLGFSANDFGFSVLAILISYLLVNLAANMYVGTSKHSDVCKKLVSLLCDIAQCMNWISALLVVNGVANMLRAFNNF